ncbi:MAG: acetoacetate decarboxylase family protein [Planctomycetes bacterium]|nr:acetoacetate decarboxylase family protein [Planctomycetota bacterium]
MGKRGALTKDKFGFSMPVDAPLYGRLPVLYKGVSMMIYEYVTSADAAAALLPAQLELLDVPGAPNAALAMVLFAEYPWSTIGPYNEAAQAILCTYKGKPMTYAVRLHVTTDRALTMGRECGGFAKKLAVIPFVRDVSYASWVERPAGYRVCSGVMESSQRLPKSLDPIQFASLRVMPNIAVPDKPSLCQLMHTEWVFTNGELWAANGSFAFDTPSDLDPYHKLPFLKEVATMLYMGEMQVSAPGEILEEF